MLSRVYVLVWVFVGFSGGSYAGFLIGFFEGFRACMFLFARVYEGLLRTWRDRFLAGRAYGLIRVLGSRFNGMSWGLTFRV